MPPPGALETELSIIRIQWLCFLQIPGRKANLKAQCCRKFCCCFIYSIFLWCGFTARASPSTLVPGSLVHQETMCIHLVFTQQGLAKEPEPKQGDQYEIWSVLDVRRFMTPRATGEATSRFMKLQWHKAFGGKAPWIGSEPSTTHMG